MFAWQRARPGRSRRCMVLVSVLALNLAPAAAAFADTPSSDTSPAPPSKEATDFLDRLTSGKIDLATLRGRKTRKSGWTFGIDGSLLHSTNAYGNSNLGQAFRVPAKSDQIGRLSIYGSGYVMVSPLEQLSASVSLGRQFFLKTSSLNFNFGSATVRAETARIPGLNAAISFSCSKEFENRSIYRNCGPEFRLRNQVKKRRNFNVELEGAVFLKNGRSIRFEDYYGGRATVLGVGKIGAFSAYGGVQYMYRRFQGGYGLLIGLDHREDHRLSIPIGVETEIAKNLHFGVDVVGSINWSNYDEYQYWDLSVGPQLRWEISR